MKEDIAKKLLEEKNPIVLLQDHPFKKFWDSLMIFLLLYVAFWLPISVSFSKEEIHTEHTFSEILDTFIDILFGIDILINFISSYED